MVTVDGRRITQVSTARVVYAVNKLEGVVSTARDTHGRPTVVSLSMPGDGSIRSAASTSTRPLVLLTDDGELAHR